MSLNKIHHRPLFYPEKVAKFYSEKDGVDVRYVCTSAIAGEAFAGDIYFRETPHPEFGNRYFRLFHSQMTRLTKEAPLMISNADAIEEVDFRMVEGTKGLEYSQHRHDFYEVEGAGVSIDGGRAYFRFIGEPKDSKVLRIVDGEFVEKVE